MRTAMWRPRRRPAGSWRTPTRRLGASCEPPLGEPVVVDVVKALQDLNRDLFVVVEQDMYPCDFGKPQPIAQRTHAYLRSIGVGEE